MKNSFIHSTALVESNKIGKNTKIWAFVHILKDVNIGENCNIADHVFIESGVNIGNNVTVKNNVCVWEGVTIEDGVFIGPNVSFTNDLFPRSPRMTEVHNRYSRKENWLVKTIVEKGSSIGANATIVGDVRIGRYSFVAAGATVTKDVEPFALVVGCPARKIGYACVCGRKVESSFPFPKCPECGATPTVNEDNNFKREVK